jgi:exportin-2 (importin alpha re-exporter)
MSESVVCEPQWVSWSAQCCAQVDPDPELFGGADVPPIADDEKEQIKGLITTLMVSTPSRVQSQLSEALTIISQHDFPGKWQALLPELTLKLKEQGNDFTVVVGVLETANSVFKRFRNAFMTPVRQHTLFQHIT